MTDDEIRKPMKRKTKKRSDETREALSRVIWSDSDGGAFTDSEYDEALAAHERAIAVEAIEAATPLAMTPLARNALRALAAQRRRKP